MLPPDSQSRAAQPNLDYILPLEGERLPPASTLSTGSTHTVLFTDEPIGEDDFRRISPLLEHHPWFPQRSSILWAQVTGPQRLELRIWERGVGETLACGTGACAAAVAARLTGRCESGTVAVRSRGGVLEVEWEPDGEIYLSGPARAICTGRVDLSTLGARVVA